MFQVEEILSWNIHIFPVSYFKDTQSFLQYSECDEIINQLFLN